MSRKILAHFVLTVSLISLQHCAPSFASKDDLVEELVACIAQFESTQQEIPAGSPKSTTFLGQLGDSVSWGIGASLRSAGEYLRTPKEGTSPKDIGFYGPIGNGLRAAGELLVGETPTLTRAILKFWIYKGSIDRPHLVITHTTTALYCRNHSIDNLLLKHGEILATLLNRGHIIYADTAGEVLNGYFVKGLVASFARSPKLWEAYTIQTFLASLRAKNIQVDDILKVCKGATDLLAACTEIFEAEKDQNSFETKRRTTGEPISSPVQIRKEPVMTSSWGHADPAPPPHLSQSPTPYSPAPSVHAPYPGYAPSPYPPVTQPYWVPPSTTPAPQGYGVPYYTQPPQWPTTPSSHSLGQSWPMGYGAPHVPQPYSAPPSITPAPAPQDQVSRAECDTSCSAPSQPQTKEQSPLGLPPQDTGQ